MNKCGSHKRIRTTRTDILVRVMCQLICLVFLAFFSIPMGYVLISSISYRGIWSFDGYKLLLHNKLVVTGVRNSLFLAGVGTLYSLLLEIPAAYVLSKKQYHYLTMLFFILGQFGVSILPLYLLLKQMHLLNTLWALILPCGLSVYYTQILRARMINIAGDLEDAAAIDGAGTMVYILKILIPVLGPTVGCIAFFHVCSYWSNTLFAQTFLTDEAAYPLSVVLLELLIKNRSKDVLMSNTSVSTVAATRMAEFALCVVSTLPLILIFMLIKKHIRTLETEGGIVL